MRYWLLSVACFVALSLSCGGDERLSEEQYFDKYRELRTDSEQFEDASSDSYGNSILADSPDEHRRAHLAMVESIHGAWSLVIDRLSPVNPPSNLEADHSDLLERVDELLRLLSRYRDALLQGDSVQPMDEGTIDEINEAEREAQTSCRMIASDAEGLGFETGLKCNPVALGDALACSAAQTLIPCDPDAVEVAPGVLGLALQPPPIPDGFIAVSGYIELHSDTAVPTTILFPLFESVSQADDPAFYTYQNGRWIRLATATVVQDGMIVQGDFDDVPDNLVVLVLRAALA